MSRNPLPIAVLISGTGRSLKNMIDRIAGGTLDIEIRLVLASNVSAKGLEFAQQAGIATAVVPRIEHDSDASFGEAVWAALRPTGAEAIVMAGFLKFLPIPPDYENRVINIHPALIPAFCGQGYYGHHVHQEVIKYGAKLSGCTVHFVDNQYDHGPIILQRSVPVCADDTPEVLAARVFDAELDALPDALQAIAEGRVSVEDRRVRISDS